jgi:hypothetical protein
MVFECHDITMIFFTSINQHMFGDKIFQTIVFSRHIKKINHCYENFKLDWSFKYSKITMVSSKSWYLKQSFLHVIQTPLERNIMIFFNTIVLPQNFKK